DHPHQPPRVPCGNRRGRRPSSICRPGAGGSGASAHHRDDGPP
ncbi:MAG: hypothetical protein AVDCRST_MAG15-2327, partial [uncultured Rubellimicrobium sp.]